MDYKKKMLYFFITYVFIALTISANLCAQNANIDLLRTKLSDVVVLREKIEKKKHQAVDIVNHLKQQKKTLVKEIAKANSKVGLASFNNANRFPRIYYNLKLIQQLNAYIKIIDAKINFFQLSDEKLKFLYRQAEDDLKIIQVLNNVKFNELIVRIETLTVHINSEIDQKLIDKNDLVFEKPEIIWNQICLNNRGKNRQTTIQ